MQEQGLNQPWSQRAQSEELLRLWASDIKNLSSNKVLEDRQEPENSTTRARTNSSLVVFKHIGSICNVVNLH